MLSKDELARADRFLHEHDRTAFTISHFELRQQLAKVVGCKPRELVFENDDHGKPHLKDFPNVHFNLSHSGDYAVIGIADAPIGVDIERVKSEPDVMALAERFFARDEIGYIQGQEGEAQRLAFFRIWTLKEAYVKAIGKGLGYGLDTFSVIGEDHRVVANIGELKLTLIKSPPDYVAAVCLKDDKLQS